MNKTNDSDEELADIGRAVSATGRVQIIQALSAGERSVEAIAAATRLSFANTSRHLRVLREAGLVDGRRDRQRVHYRLTGPAVLGLLDALRALAHLRPAEGDAPDTPIDRETLLERARRNEVRVIDVRSATEFAAGHVAGALSVPIEEIEQRAENFSRERELVAYSRGRSCPLARRAVEVLRARGFRAMRLVDGFPEWRAAGLPVEEG
ncbi:MAG: metalloregulator ArsR/SmtB family transcription factor [Myxococcota bacterium]